MTQEEQTVKKHDRTAIATIQQIAREELDIQTLDARNRDQLDFHEVAVWKIRKARRRAYEAGRARTR